MEFEEIQEIWDLQKKQSMYTINEKVLHGAILVKKKKAQRLVNVSEWFLVAVNLIAGAVVFGLNFSNPPWNFFLYGMAIWMVATATFILLGRMNRLKRANMFDLNMRGSLQHAIADATYWVRVSQLMRWNILPITVFILLGMWAAGKPVWIMALTFIFFGITYYASGVEHNCYKARKQELISLFEKLEQGESQSI